MIVQHFQLIVNIYWIYVMAEEKDILNVHA